MSERPNLILISTDQQRFDTLQCAGNRQIWTPHLNWLCDNGIRYTNAYSDCPVCMPARVTLMSGQHAWRHGMMSNRWIDGAYAENHSLPGLLTQAGYQSCLVGKNHNGPTRRHRMGFESMIESAEYYQFFNRYPELARPRASGHGLNEHVPGIDTAPEEHTLSHWLVSRSMDFLENRDPAHPFFLWLSFDDPHPPFLPAMNHWQMYQNAPVPAPVYGDWSRSLEMIAPAWLGVTRELSMTQRLSPEEIAIVRRAYYALITQVDAHLGILFGRLRELNLLEKTVILFTADHGDMQGDHHMGGKCVPFEGSAHIPMILKLPAAPRDHHHAWRGADSNALVCLADVLPTFLNFARANAPNGTTSDGFDLLAAWQNRTHREELFGTCMYLHYMRSGQYKYCLETLAGNELLFDLANDPYEQLNLANGVDHVEIVKAMRARMRAHLAANQLQNGLPHDPGVARSDQDMPSNVHPGHWSGRMS